MSPPDKQREFERRRKEKKLRASRSGRKREPEILPGHEIGIPIVGRRENPGGCYGDLFRSIRRQNCGY